jgi:nitroreductase
MSADINLLDAISTQRAIRHFSDRPVSDADLRLDMEAAVRAPNAGNRQQWRFLVLRDGETKRRMGDWYLRAWTETPGRMGAEARTQPYRSGAALARGMGRVPVLVLACIQAGGGPPQSGLDTRGASIYPAVQNMMLAARALGLGTVMTTLHTRFESEVKALLGIPDDVHTAALVPIGYPSAPDAFGAGSRLPLEAVAFGDRWGSPAF